MAAAADFGTLAISTSCFRSHCSLHHSSILPYIYSPPTFFRILSSSSLLPFYSVSISSFVVPFLVLLSLLPPPSPVSCPRASGPGRGSQLPPLSSGRIVAGESRSGRDEKYFPPTFEYFPADYPFDSRLVGRFCPVFARVYPNRSDDSFGRCVELAAAEIRDRVQNATESISYGAVDEEVGGGVNDSQDVDALPVSSATVPSTRTRRWNWPLCTTPSLAKAKRRRSTVKARD